MLRKMCRYISAECLCELCVETVSKDTASTTQPPFPAQISEVLAVALDSEDDIDTQLTALHIVNDLLAKSALVFDEQFVRLGIPTKILHLAKDASGNDETDAAPVEAVKSDIDIGEAAKNEIEVKKAVKDESEVLVVPLEGSSVDREGRD